MLQEGIALPEINKVEPRTIMGKYTLQSDSGSRNQTIMEFIQHIIKEKKLGAAQLEIYWREHLARLKVGSTSVFLDLD